MNGLNTLPASSTYTIKSNNSAKRLLLDEEKVFSPVIVKSFDFSNGASAITNAKVRAQTLSSVR